MPATTLRDLRQEKHLSLRQVQTETGIFPAHLSEIERGKRLISPEQMSKLAALYGVDLSDWRFMLVAGS